MMKSIWENSEELEALTVFAKKIITYIWEGSNYASLAVSFLYIVKKSYMKMQNKCSLSKSNSNASVFL